MLAALGSKNLKYEGKIKVKEKNPKSDSEDEGSNSTDEGSNFKKKGNNKGRSHCNYCRKYSHNENYCFKKKMDVMTHFLEINNIDVPDFARREEFADPRGTITLCNSHVMMLILWLLE